jgi:uroporphyrinogen-III decarboxylase
MRFLREEYIDLMTFGPVERQMFVELFGPLVGVRDEWAAQGASPEELDLVAFDWDYVPIVDCGGNTLVHGGEPEAVLEETDEYVIERDRLGRRMKLFKNVASIPLPLDHPVKNMDTWLEVKPLFQFHPDRIDRDAVEHAQKEQAQGCLVLTRIPGGFDTVRQLMGVEGACLCYLDQPELMHDIMETITETSCRVLEPITEKLVIDQVSVHEDLAGKAGPLIGPEQFDRFVKPYYRAVWDLLSARGTRIFDMDTDGNVMPLLDSFLDAGLTALAPIEPSAGMDAVAIRKQYGRRLAMKGGIDKFVLKQDRGAIRRELEYKMQPRMQEGGMVFGLDHRIPNGTPLQNYRFYVELGREILGLPVRDGKSQGWRRMAF